jgi:CO/xanthine dehydrogenase Mo-binding subunit
MRALQAYVDEIASLMGLGDWQIIVEPGFAEDGSHGESSIAYGRQAAVLRFGEETFSQKRDEVRDTVVHELLHCHLERLRVDHRAATEQLTGQARALARDSFYVSLEQAIDKLAAVFARGKPYPRWGADI